MMIILAILSLQLTSAWTQQIRDPSHLPDLFLFKKNSQCRDEDRKDCQKMSAFELFDTKFRRERQSGDFEDRNSSESTELFKRSAGELSQGLDDGEVQSKLRYSPTVNENFVSTTPSYGRQSTESPSRKVERSIAVTERPAFSYQFTTTDGLGYVHVQIGKAATTPYPAQKKIPSGYHPSQIPSTKPYHPPPVISTTPYPVHKPDLKYHSEHAPQAPQYTPALAGHNHHPPVYQAPVYKPPVVSTTPYPVHKKTTAYPYPIHKEKPPTYHPSAVPMVHKLVKKTHLEEPKVATVTVKSMPDLKYHSEHAPQYTPAFTGHHHHHHPPVYQAPVYRPEVHYPVTPIPQYQEPPKPQYPPVYHPPVYKPEKHYPVTPKPQYQEPPKPVYHPPVYKPEEHYPVTPKPHYHAPPKPQYPPVYEAPVYKPEVHYPVTPKPQYQAPEKPQYPPVYEAPVYKPEVHYPVTPKPKYQAPEKPQYPPVYHAPAPAPVVSSKPTVLLQADSAVSHFPPLIAASSLEHQILGDKGSTAKLGRVLEQFKNRSVLSLMGADFKVSGPYFVVTPQPGLYGREQEHHQGSISFPQ